jgi:hypothetical protein
LRPNELHKYEKFFDFLLPPKDAKLCLAAKYGPVIMLNHVETHTDAIIILTPSTPPVLLPLSISVASITEKVKSLKGALHKLSIQSREACYGRFHKAHQLSSSDMFDSVIVWLCQAYL